MKQAEIATALVMIALAGVVVIGTRDLPYWTDFAPGGAFAPVWVAMVTTGLALLLIVSALPRKTSQALAWPDRAGCWRVGLTAAGLWLVLVLSPWLGLMPAVTAFAALLLIVVLRRPPIPSLAATAAIAGLVYGVFAVWLKIPMPIGILGL
jgi:putative tricarboxylic transport membrane protein